MKKASIGITIIVLLVLTAYPMQVDGQIAYPSPSYEFSPLTPRVGDTVTFDASDFISYWKVSTIVSLDWDFADGTTGKGTVVNHVFTHLGERTLAGYVSRTTFPFFNYFNFLENLVWLNIFWFCMRLKFPSIMLFSIFCG